MFWAITSFKIIGGISGNIFSNDKREDLKHSAESQGKTRSVPVGKREHLRAEIPEQFRRYIWNMPGAYIEIQVTEFSRLYPAPVVDLIGSRGFIYIQRSK